MKRESNSLEMLQYLGPRRMDGTKKESVGVHEPQRKTRKMHQTKVYLAFLLTVIGVLSKPLDEPNKVGPDVVKIMGNSTRLYVPTKWDRGMELLGQIMDAMRFGTGRLVNFFMMARNVIAERAEEFKSEAANKVVAVIAARDARKIIQKTQKRSVGGISGVAGAFKPDINLVPSPQPIETVQLMSEAGQGLFEAPKQKPIEEFLISITNPVPVVDRITEKDKYGNTGEQFRSPGRAVVNNVENLSNFINALIDAPGKALRSASKSLTTALDRVGARLVGLL